MREVKRIFFISEEEAKKLDNKYIYPPVAFKNPCFELEDGTIMYPHYGCPAGGETSYEKIN